MGRDYATVHRGVYARSADMTLAYEAARRRIAAFIGARENEIAFVRGATEAINLVAYSHPKKGRVLLSTLEHHSRSEEHTSELQSLMRISYAVFCLKKKNNK